MPNYKLTYFDARGSAEPCRFIFAYAKVDYEDVRITIGELTDERRNELKLQYGYLPTLEIDGEVYSQSAALTRYLAHKYGLGGSTEFENLRIDEYADQIRDYFMKFTPLFYDSTPEDKKTELRETLLTVENPKIMSKFNDIILENMKENQEPWLVGAKFTWVDIMFAHFTQTFEISLEMDLTSIYSQIVKLRESVFSQPGIKEWLEKRPLTKF